MPPPQRTAGAPVPLTGRYAAQGAQMRAGLELWARRAGAALLIEDDESRPERAVRLYEGLLRRCGLVLGPYGSDSTRMVAKAGFPGVLWNHGAAADDVQAIPGVVSLPSPASGYLAALAQAVADLRPGAAVALATGSGPFARFAREGLERAASRLPIELAGSFSLGDSDAIARASPAAVLLCGPVREEIALLHSLVPRLPETLFGGVSPGLAAFPKLLGRDPEGLMAPSQWHPSLGLASELGPSSAEVVAEARANGLPPLDYVAAQAYAAALVATRCLELSPDDPLAAARGLTTTTFFGSFALDPKTGLQRAHRLCVVRWRDGRQELLRPSG